MEHPEPNLLFRSIASLSLFRKENPPRAPPYTKPYQVFPGIWNTDATAKVFGYLDSNKPPLSQSMNESPIQRQKSNRRTHLRSLALAGKLRDRYREVHTDDGTDDFSRRTHRQHVEAWDHRRQGRRDEAKKEREASQRSAMRARMRTVSRDDELVQRGANPRTGVVSPELVTDNSEESVGDSQIAVGHWKEPGRRKREGSGKWKQNDLGWSLIESPSFGPSAEDLIKEPGRVVLADKLHDPFVAVIPGVNNPAPMAPTQIQHFQERFRDIYTSGRAKSAGEGPRQWIPEESWNRVQNIPRKEVGSGQAQRNVSTDTVIIQDQTRASFSSSLRKNNMTERRVRIVTPLSTPTSNSIECSPYDRKDRGFDSGSYPEELPCQTTNSIEQSFRPKMHHGIDHLVKAKAPTNSTPPVPPLSTSSPPRKYDPSLDFLHPNQISSLAKSYRRPKELQPAVWRAVKSVKNTSSGHDSSPNVASDQGLRIEERSQIQLPSFAAEIPTGSIPNSEKRRLKNLVPETQPAIPSFLPTTLKASKTASKAHDERIHKNRRVPDALGIDGTRGDKKNEGAENQLEGHSAAASCSCTKCDDLQSLAAIRLLTTKKGPSPRSANIARDPLHNKAGSVPVNIDRDKTREAISGAKMNPTTGTRTQSKNKSPYQNLKGPSELDITCSERFIGHRAKGVDDDKHDEQNKQSRIERLAYEASTLGVVVGLWRLIALVEQKLYDSISIRSIQRRLVDMVHHVLRTLHTSSPALEVLRMPNANVEEYLAALKDLIRAIFYLLILLNIVMVIGKVLRLAAIAINLIWFPLKLVLLVARWFILG